MNCVALISLLPTQKIFISKVLIEVDGWLWDAKLDFYLNNNDLGVADITFLSKEPAELIEKNQTYNVYSGKKLIGMCRIM